METNERLLGSIERERVQLKFNCHYVCSVPGLIQIVELILPPLGFLFITIQILDSSLIELSNRWIIVQLFLILLRLIPFLFFEVHQQCVFKRAMLYYEMGMTMAILCCYVAAIPFIFSKDEPRAINMMVFIICGILINTAHIGWIIFRIIYSNIYNW